MSAVWNSLVMKHFDVPNNAHGVIRVKCKHCTTFITGTSTSAGNFLKHLKRKHLEIYVHLIKLKGDHPKEAVATSYSKISESQTKANYTSEFKQKVLEHYFKNGGSDNYGLKTKTAQLFNIDKKTINRMLSNEDMVRKACKAINQKPPTFVQDYKYASNTSSLSESQKNSTMPSVVELPEDPDFASLKSTIATSVNGVGNNAKLLLTGTKEVQNILLNECDIIYECKVCRNLFRSVVNLLAHKRIYCQEQYLNVKTIYEKDSTNLTVESNTVIVEPEVTKKPKIDDIACKLATKTDQPILSSSVHKGSSHYYSTIEDAQKNRRQLNKDSSIEFSNISGVKNAVFQDYIPPQGSKPSESAKELHYRVSQEKLGVTAVLNVDGEIVGTVPGAPSSIQTKNFKIEPEVDASPEASSCDGNESDDQSNNLRTVYTCPICSIQFLSLGGVCKHLTKVHKKKRHQRHRLRKVITDRTFKKYFTKAEIRNYHSKERRSAEDEPTKQLKQLDEIKKEPEEEEDNKMEGRMRNVCERCKRRFLTGGGLGSHMKYCLYRSFNPNVNNDDSSEKKISIQIRKDYKKENVQDDKKEIKKGVKQQSIQDRTKPGENEKLNQENILEYIAEKNKLLSNDNPLHCVPCEKTFVKRLNLLYHFSKHYEHTKYKCKVCGFRCFHKHLMLRHCQNEHSGQSNSFVLSHKIGNFSFYLNKLPEGKNKTNRQADNQCEIEPSIKIEKVVKEESMEVKGDLEEKYNQFSDSSKTFCLHCKRKFQKKSMLMYHIAKHLEHTRYSCNYCNFKCYHRYTIAEHCTNFHKDGTCFVFKDQLGELRLDLTSKADQLKNIRKSDSYNSIASQSPIPNGDTESRSQDDLPSNNSEGSLDASKEKDYDMADDSQKTERPQRQRRSVERKDFIYEIKRPLSANKMIDEESQKNGEKRKMSPDEEEPSITIVRKKIKTSQNEEQSEKVKMKLKLPIDQAAKRSKSMGKEDLNTNNCPNVDVAKQLNITIKKLKGNELQLSSKKSKENNKINVGGLCFLKKSITGIKEKPITGIKVESNKNSMSHEKSKDNSTNLNSSIREGIDVGRSESVQVKLKGKCNESVESITETYNINCKSVGNDLESSDSKSEIVINLINPKNNESNSQLASSSIDNSKTESHNIKSKSTPHQDFPLEKVELQVNEDVPNDKSITKDGKIEIESPTKEIISHME